MKIEMKIVVTILAWMLLFSAARAQDPRDVEFSTRKAEKYRRDKAAMEQAASLSESAEALHDRLSGLLSSKEFNQAISEVVEANDRSVIPYLKARLEADYDGKSSIEVALVRLGEKVYFDKTVAELSSENISIQDQAVWKLSMFRTKEAYRKLFELLDDERVRDPVDHGDYVVPSFAHMVKERLASTVEDPPKGDLSSTAVWKAWFERNRRLID